MSEYEYEYCFIGNAQPANDNRGANEGGAFKAKLRSIGLALLAGLVDPTSPTGHDWESEEDGTVSGTGLAIAIACGLGRDEWLDLDTHPVWDVALDLANTANARA